MAPWGAFGGRSSPNVASTNASGRGSPTLKSAGAIVLAAPGSSSSSNHKGTQIVGVISSSSHLTEIGAQRLQQHTPPSRLAISQKLRSSYGNSRRPATTIEMLQYIKGLGIDPIHESELLWIAEEAYNAKLPPSWGEHQDDRGRIYFHNSATGISAWQHPMDDLYREVVDYQRKVQALCGFWDLDRHIEELEAHTRAELSEWSELFDEHGEKFFFNANTKASRFDDPRLTVYHALSSRIRAVAKMKEKLPLLSAAKKPDDASEQELLLRRAEEREQDVYVGTVLRLQSAARVMLARKRVSRLRQNSQLLYGVQPLRNMMQLRMERVAPGGRRELMLGQTTPHKRAKAAAKIQARCRGILVRKHFKPLLEHEAYKHRCSVVMQAYARRWLAMRRVTRLKVERIESGAQALQKLWKGHEDRRYVSSIRSERARCAWMLQCIVRLQCGFRCALARREARRRRKGIFR